MLSLGLIYTALSNSGGVEGKKKQSSFQKVYLSVPLLSIKCVKCLVIEQLRAPPTHLHAPGALSDFVYSLGR